MRWLRVDSIPIFRRFSRTESRDYIDSHRETSPLRQAEDAVVLDNSDMTLQDQMVWIKKLVEERFGK